MADERDEIIRELVEALTPFALSEHNAKLSGVLDSNIDAPHWTVPHITLGDLRRARAALERAKEQTP